VTISQYLTTNIWLYVWPIYLVEGNDEEFGDSNNEAKYGLVEAYTSGEFLQIGHVPFILSHSSIQAAWK
jgi:hypothetical protein